MSKKRKSLLVYLFFIVVMLGIYWVSSPKELSIKVWIPERSSLSNTVEGKYTLVEKVSVSGTVIFVPFDQYQDRFGTNDHTVIVQREGDVYYITKVDGRTYVSVKEQFLSIIDGLLRTREAVSIDLSSGIMTLSYNRNLAMCLVITSIILFVVILKGCRDAKS